MTTLYTLGYESLSVPQLLKLLGEHGIRRVVDVRDRPWSRRRGFSATPLFEALRREEIAYESGFGLGNPVEIRALWKNGQLEQGKTAYRRLLTNGRRQQVAELVKLAELAPTALLCLEEDPDRCHRKIIAETAQGMAPGLVIHHLHQS